MATSYKYRYTTNWKWFPQPMYIRIHLHTFHKLYSLSFRSGCTELNAISVRLYLCHFKRSRTWCTEMFQCCSDYDFLFSLSSSTELHWWMHLYCIHILIIFLTIGKNLRSNNAINPDVYLNWGDIVDAWWQSLFSRIQAFTLPTAHNEYYSTATLSLIIALLYCLTVISGIAT